MSAMSDIFVGPRCYVCGKSKRFFEEDGFWYCYKCGERQEGLSTKPGEDEFGSQGRKSRVKRQKLERGSQIYRGTQALNDFLQCYQLILWKQCHALIQALGMPSQLEAVVKDLWALRLQLLRQAFTIEESDSETLFSSQPVSEEATQNEGVTQPKGRSKAMPTLIESLGLCYLAAMILRLPTSMGEVHRWGVAEDVPYVRAIRHIPAIVKKRLPAEYILALDTTSPLEPNHLCKAVQNLCLLYKQHFDITLPPLNTPLLLYKHIRELALPMPTYQAVRSIASLVSADFAFPIPSRHQRVSNFPEILLVSLIVVVVKLYYPLDKIDRSVESLKHPATLSIDWSSWVDAKMQQESHLKEGEHLRRGTEINVTESDVMNMSGEQLEDYLDWYERTWVDDERTEQKARGLPKQLLEMFPTGRQDGSFARTYDYRIETEKQHQHRDQRVQETMNNLKLRQILNDEREDEGGRMRIGSMYKRYRSAEDLTPFATAFHAAAASAVGIKLETLLTAVLQVERKLIVWREKQLKAGDDRQRQESTASENDEQSSRA